MKRRGLALAAGAIALAVVLALIPPSRRAALRAIGGVLIVNDPIAAADIGVMTESGEAGELEMSDLFEQHVIPRVLILAPAQDSVAQELARRGVHREDLVVAALVQLGVPPAAITTIDAGDGGTLESTQALAAWVRTHPSRVLIIVDPTHARRYRRTLMRAWPADVPPPGITCARANPFRADDWWVSRRTRRDGIVELGRLAWDVLWHPL